MKNNLNIAFFIIFALCAVLSAGLLIKGANPDESREKDHSFLFQKDQREAEAAREKSNSLTSDGVWAYRNGNFDAALEYFDKAVRADNKNQTAFYYMGAVLNEAGKHKEAASALKKALKLKGIYNKADLYNSAGFSFFMMKKYKEAIKMYKKSIELNEDNPLGYAGLGCALHEMGRYEQAIQAFDKALSKDYEIVGVYNSRGIAFSKIGKYEEAASDFKEFMRMQPEDTDIAFYNLTETYILMDDLMLARRYLDSYLRRKNYIYTDDYKLWTGALKKSSDKELAAEIKNLIDEKLVKKERSAS